MKAPYDVIRNRAIECGLEIKSAAHHIEEVVRKCSRAELNTLLVHASGAVCWRPCAGEEPPAVIDHGMLKLELQGLSRCGAFAAYTASPESQAVFRALLPVRG